MRALGAVPGYPLRGFIIGVLVVMLVCAIAAPVLYIADLEPVWWIVSACFAGSCLFSLIVIALISRPYVRDIDTIRENHLVHWEYAADEWARYEEAEWQRGQRDARMYPIFSLILALIVAGITFVSSRHMLLTLGAFGLFLGIGAIITLQTIGTASWRYARRYKAHGDVFISSTGILRPSGYLPYNGHNLRLIAAEIEPGDPDMLRLEVSSYTEHAVPRTSAFRIPVPYGREGEAREVAQQLLGISAARNYEPTRIAR